MSISAFVEKGAEFKNLLALQKPLGLKFCQSLDEIPAKARRPIRDFKVHMAICQAVNLSRTFGYTFALTLEDMFCLPGAAVFGLCDFRYSFYPHHVKDEEAGRKLDVFFHEKNVLIPKGAFQALVISPLDRLLVEPDLILAYGSPAQISKVAKAIAWHGETITSTYAGGLGCSSYVTSFAEKRPLIKVAAGGEKVLAGTGEHEMDIVFPADRLDDVLEGLKGTQRMLPYPMVSTAFLSEPSVPEDYKITFRELEKEG
jgi:uncharacterized protein (DUF169 family)